MESKYFYSSTEVVSSGHPDRLADNCAAALIDRIQKKDGPNSHAAVEVAIANDKLIFSGEVTTSLDITQSLLREVAEEAYTKSGYIPAFRKYFTKSQCALLDDMEIYNFIHSQSPDIALGTTDQGVDSGFNDQGVFYSTSDNTTPNHVGILHQIAHEICRALQGEALNSVLVRKDPTRVLGVDNKTIVTGKFSSDAYTLLEITAITIAVAHSEETPTENVREIVLSVIDPILHKYHFTMSSEDILINGTGRFVVHGSVGDSSCQGRKLSVNTPSAGPIYMYKNLGGGSKIKPWHASDFLLDVYSRFIANVIVASNLSDYALVGTSCAIGQKNLQSISIIGDKKFNEFTNYDKIVSFFSQDVTPKYLANLFGLFSDNFSFLECVDYNFYGYPSKHPWDNPTLIDEWSHKLIDYLKL